MFPPPERFARWLVIPFYTIHTLTDATACGLAHIQTTWPYRITLMAVAVEVQCARTREGGRGAGGIARSPWSWPTSSTSATAAPDEPPAAGGRRALAGIRRRFPLDPPVGTAGHGAFDVLVATCCSRAREAPAQRASQAQ